MEIIWSIKFIVTKQCTTFIYMTPFLVITYSGIAF